MTCNFFSSTAFFRICFRSAIFVVLAPNELVNKGLQGKAKAGHEPLTFLPFQYKQITGKPGKNELRPLGIPTIEDRAKQMLAKLALEPEWEAIFEPNSYGFRPGRSCHDAVASLFLSLRGKSRYVLDADIQKCFDRIDHEKLLKKLIRTFLCH